MLFILVQLTILLIVIFLLYLLTWFWPPDSPWAPWWKTSGALAPAIKRLTGLKKSDVVYELGSGDAEAMITVSKKYGNKYVGIEVDPWRVFTARVRAKRTGVTDRVSFIKKSFFGDKYKIIMLGKLLNVSFYSLGNYSPNLVLLYRFL